VAEIKSLLRKIVKPILFKFLNEEKYLKFQYIAKIKDIEKKLVEEDEMELIPFLVDKDSISFDIGANYAYYTERLGKLCSDGKIYAFEPIPPTFKVCSMIVEHYKLNNVVMLEKGVGAKNSKVKFEVPIQDSGFLSSGQAHFSGRHNTVANKEIYYPWQKDRTYECEVVSIDEEFKDLQKLDFIKMDIEGAELYALNGMENTLKRLRPTMLIEICKFWLDGFNITAKEMNECIERLGYDIYRYSKKDKSFTKVDSLEADEKFNFVDKVNFTPFAPNYFLIPKEKVEVVNKIKQGLAK